ncbi:hypothetical protein [Streptomyces sp. NPDC021224]|uniref:hypothetical protein n=1 Tax=unclassified Streptomyces TaxID=2593676 RepID=UPI0037929E9F
MPRSSRRARRLLVGEAAYRWSVRHRHHVPDGGGYQHCTEVVTLRRDGARGAVRVSFTGGPGRAVPDGILHSGAVGTDEGYLNLHEPGTARALLDEALARGWDPDTPSPLLLDGWTLFSAVRARTA